MNDRPITNIDRKVELKGDTVNVVSKVKESMNIDFFLEQNQQKVIQLNTNKQQLSAVMMQIKSLESGLPALDEEQMKELLVLKDRINIIRNQDKLRTLKQNAQRLEVDINILTKDLETFREVETEQKAQSVDSQSVDSTAEVKKS